MCQANCTKDSKTVSFTHDEPKDFEPSLLEEPHIGHKKHPMYKLAAQGQLPKPAELLRKLKQEFPEGFTRKIWMDVYYTVRQFALVFLAAYALHYSTSYGNLTSTQTTAVTMLYVIFQSFTLSGMCWLVHEMCHYTMRKNRPFKWLFDMMGLVMSSCIMMPYHQFRYSHCKIHHAHTNNSEHDESYFPIIEHEGWKSGTWASIQRCILAPIFFRFYLFNGYDGGDSAFVHYSWPGMKRNNATTEAAYATKDWAFWGKVSILSCVAVFFGILYAFATFGFYPVFIYAILPIIGQDTMFIILSFNHHTHEETVWMNDETWTFLTGVLSSVDRDYGWIVNNLVTHINLHVVHHLCMDVPHYHTPKMTEIFREHFGDLYVQDKENGFVSFAKNWFGFACNGYLESGATEQPQYWSWNTGSFESLF